MNFAMEANLVWFWLLIPVAALWIWGVRRIRGRLTALYRLENSTLAGPQPSRFEMWMRGAVMVVVVALIVLAIAQPRWGFRWDEVKRQGVDIMVAVDVSQSMRAEDVSPSRLERAKRELRDLLGMLRGDRIGLMAFAGIPFIQCPLTTDYGAVGMFLDFLDTDLIPIQGTSMGAAIRLGIESLQESAPEVSMGKVMILITDGEEQDVALDDALVEAKEAGVKIYTIAVGDAAGAPIPELGGGFKKDDKGQVIISKWDPKILGRIASDTGGLAVVSQAGDQDLLRIYMDGIKESNEGRELQVVRRKIWYERFQWFLAVAGLLLLLELWMGLRLRSQASSPAAGPFPAIFAGAIIVALTFSEAAFAAGERSAHRAYKNGKFAEAAQLFQNLEVDRPSDAVTVYNRALAQYRAGDFDEAALGFAKAASLSKDPKLQADAWFNAGNSQAKAGQLEKALASYDASLERLPEQGDVKANRDAVEAYLKQQQEQKDQQTDDGQQKQQGQENEQQQGAEPQNSSEHADSTKKASGSKAKEKGQPEQGSQTPEDSDNKTNHNQEEVENSAKSDGGSEETVQGDQQPSGESEGRYISRAEAEKLLRAVPDKARKYMGQPADAIEAQGRQGGKDW